MPARGYEISECSIRHRVEHEDSRTFSKDFRRFLKCSEDCPKFIQTFPIILQKFPKVFEDYQRLPSISEQSSKMFRLHRNKVRFVQLLNLENLIAQMTSISNLSTHVKISNM